MKTAEEVTDFEKEFRPDDEGKDNRRLRSVYFFFQIDKNAYVKCITVFYRNSIKFSFSIKFSKNTFDCQFIHQNDENYLCIFQFMSFILSSQRIRQKRKNVFKIISTK